MRGIRFTAALDDDFNTPDALAVTALLARPRAAPPRARRLRARVARGRSRPRRAEVRRSRRAAAGGAVASATSPRPTGCATRSPERAGSCATSPAASSSSRAVTARPGLRASSRARGAARPAARCSSSGRPNARSPPRHGSREAPLRVQVKLERELTDAAGTRDHQGVVAWTEPYRYADAWELAARERPLLACLDQVTDPRNLGAVFRSAGGRGRDRRRSCRPTARRR